MPLANGPLNKGRTHSGRISRCGGDWRRRHEEKQFRAASQPSLLDDARKAAEAEGVALDPFINVAVAEKAPALRTDAISRERTARADIPRALDILRHAGIGNAPVKGGELDGEQT